MSVIMHSSLPSTLCLNLSDKQKIDITNYINQYRKAHDSPNLVWDDTIYTFSQEWANYLLKNNLFQHSGKSGSLYGENLAYFQDYGKDIMVLLKLSIDLWYNEVALYDFSQSQPTLQESTSHFTSLIWKSSTTYAIAIAIINETVVICFNTSPPPNQDYNENILPRNMSVKLPTPAEIPLSTPQHPQHPQHMSQPTQYMLQPTQPMSQPVQFIPKPVSNMFIIETKTIFLIINNLHKIINELNKARPNKHAIICIIKNIIIYLSNV